MIIGSGMLAKAFNIYKADHDLLIFASGVANSQEENRATFQREADLLATAVNQNLKLVYFSTCSIDDRAVNFSPYVQHKIKMEELIQNECKQFFILRLPQVVGKNQ